MIISQSGIVDIIPEYNRQLRPIFCVSEGDKNTRMINITVQQAGENFSIPSGASVYVTGKKQDNTIFTYQCTKSGYIVSFQIAEQMSAANGIVLCELQIIENGNPLGSANFVYWVEPSPVQDGTASESDLNVFLEAIIGADKLDHFWANVEEAVTEAVEAIQIHEGQTVIDASLSVSGAAADAKATGDIVRAFMDALVTETTEEATIATCDDAAGGLPLKKLTANIEPTQSGTGDPSPDNVRPISGYSAVNVYRSGKNLAEGFTLKTDVVEKVGDDSYKIIKIGSGIANRSGDADVNLKANTQYIFTCDIELNTPSIKFRAHHADGTYEDVTTTIATSGSVSEPFTPSKVCDYIEAYLSSGNSDLNSYAIVSNMMLRLATETDATYKAPQIDTYPITFPTAAGTVYGGTLTVNSDGSGTLTVDKGITTVADHNWSYLTSYTRFTTTIADIKKGLGVRQVPFVCSQYVSVDDGRGVAEVPNNSIYGSGTGGSIYIVDQRYTDPAEFKTANGTVQIVYPLEQPTTYALSAVQVAELLQGVNNLWTDAAGTVTGEYYASTALYVQKIVNAQKGMIAGVEAEMTASKNYSVGDLMIVGDALYKATAAISSGAALTVGTNIAQTTVAEQLIALANA